MSALRPIHGPLDPAALDALRLPSPFLALDLDAVERAFAGVRRALSGIGVHYAVKCNPEPALLARLHALGAGFEIASLAELRLLVALGVDARGVLYSNPVKAPSQIAAAFALGVERFAADSRCELEKLAAHAPGARVYVRLDASDPTSRVPLAGKFGVDPKTAVELLVESRALGLAAHGLTFHVGSQALDPRAYARAIELSGVVMRAARTHRLQLELLDIGGGLPARYTGPVPPMRAFGAAIEHALARLPYPLEVVAEPGRALVAEAGVLATTVIGVAERAGRRWVHLDVGAFNGMMETLETRRELIFPIAWSGGGPRRLVPCAVTGPTCDSEDTMFFDVLLPDDLRPDDRLYIQTAGAYTTAYASRFNGFDVPRTHVVGGLAAEASRPARPQLALAASGG
ncbi:MAG: ornithine decarboxylase [Gaiellales bacterium]|nr:ornithine decarboxylase [Gaiellales bacterium]